MKYCFTKLLFSYVCKWEVIVYIICVTVGHGLKKKLKSCCCRNSTVLETCLNSSLRDDTSPSCVSGTVPTVVSKTEGSSKVRDLNVHISHMDIYGLYLTLTSAKGGCVGSAAWGWVLLVNRIVWFLQGDARPHSSYFRTFWELLQHGQRVSSRRKAHFLPVS